MNPRSLKSFIVVVLLSGLLAAGVAGWKWGCGSPPAHPVAGWTWDDGGGAQPEPVADGWTWDSATPA